MSEALKDVRVNPGKPLDEPKLLADGLPPDSPRELIALAHAQGVAPVENAERLMGNWSDDDGQDDTDVETFLNARRRWALRDHSGFPYGAPRPAPKPEQEQR